VAVESLVAASEEDAATGGPDIKRGIYPTIVTVTSDGVEEIDDDELASITSAVVERRP
jgi:proteasome beta subunit